MNDGKYFSFYTTVMNAPCDIPLKSTLFFGEQARTGNEVDIDPIWN
jgi:hypothetical protein